MRLRREPEVLPAPIGFVEGFYGEPWSWSAREEAIPFMAGAGLSFYIYAPKGDAWFRKRWREPIPADHEAKLAGISAAMRAGGIDFGVGFSPYEIYRSFDEEAKRDLLSRIRTLNGIGVDHLGILFDDMRGDLPRVAETQAEVVHFVREHSRAREISMCPTYYSTDPILDRLFGERAPTYLEDLGRALDPSIQVFWTGPRICSTEYPPEHLREVTGRLGRKLLLWDNYPVNDGQKMCKFLHLGAFTGRPAAMGEFLTAHAVNPMNQPVLSRIPALTLVESYRLGAGYAPGLAFTQASTEVLGAAFAAAIAEDLETLQLVGLEKMTDARKAALRAQYSAFLPHPAAREILDWLDGRYEVSRELVLTQ